MSAVVCLPLWQWLAYVAVIVSVLAPAVGIPSAIFGARYGAKMAIELCSSHWGCAMRVDETTKTETQNLEEQLLALRAAHPEIKLARDAMKRALNETGERPVVK